MSEIKQLIITGDSKVLQWITRILCGVLVICTITKFINYNGEGKQYLETNL